MLKMFKSFFLEIFFDHKDEYKFSSEKFNLVKVLTLIVLVFSMFCNYFLFTSYLEVAQKYLVLKEKEEKLSALEQEKDSKK